MKPPSTLKCGAHPDLPAYPYPELCPACFPKGRKRPTAPLVECYRTGVRDRFVCLDRWPEQPSKWCGGCCRMALAISRTSVRAGGKLARTEVEPKALATPPAPSHHLTRRR